MGPVVLVLILLLIIILVRKCGQDRYPEGTGSGLPAPARDYEG